MVSSGGAFTPLCQLHIRSHRWSRVRVRVSRIWVASNPINGSEYGLDCLLIDNEGATMQARAWRRDMKQLIHKLVEGKVYALSNFTVRPSLQSYMASRNTLMIVMGQETLVNEMEDGIGFSIPLHSFEFVDFGEVRSRSGDKRFFTDVIGQIVSIEDAGQTWKWKHGRNILFRNIHLRDFSGEELNVALFGDLGINFDSEQVCRQGREVPVVAVFAGMLVRRYAGFTVCSTSASKYYLDLDIPEVQEFRARLANPHKPVDRLTCQLQNPVKLSELLKSWRTIKQLKSLDPYELEWNTTFLCRATVKDVHLNRTKSWWYQSCFHCRHSVNWDGTKSFCFQGCPNGMSPVPRYKLDVELEDSTGSMNVMIFGEPAQELVGVAAEVLVEEVTAHRILAAIIRLRPRRAFVIGPGNGCFVVRNILDDDALQLCGSDLMAVGGGGELSQDEGSSSASYSSSSGDEEEEEEVIEEETKPKRVKTEQTDAE